MKRLNLMTVDLCGGHVKVDIPPIPVQIIGMGDGTLIKSPSSSSRLNFLTYNRVWYCIHSECHLQPCRGSLGGRGVRWGMPGRLGNVFHGSRESTSKENPVSLLLFLLCFLEAKGDDITTKQSCQDILYKNVLTWLHFLQITAFGV